MNKQMMALIAVAVVAAVAAILFLLPSESPVTVPDPGTKGVATVAPDPREFKVDDAAKEAAVEPEHRGKSIVTYDIPESDKPYVPITRQLGLEPTAGVPLDRHGALDSALWVGTYRMILKEEGESDLARRVHEMGTTVSSVTSANDLASYSALFAEEKRLLGEVRGSTTNAEILANCDRLYENIIAVESGHLHPKDKAFETADANQ